jgi:hypothetical protein
MPYLACFQDGNCDSDQPARDGDDDALNRLLKKSALDPV